MTDLLYEWPGAARVRGGGRVISKTKFYEYAKASTALKDRFVDEVQKVTWIFRLSEDTVRLRPSDRIPEVQVFRIDLKGDELTPKVLAAIDKAIRKPVVFELIRGQDDRPRIRMVAAYKPVGAPNPTPEDYLSTAWMDIDSERSPLPPALDLARLYVGLISPLLPVQLRDGEPVEEALVRIAEIRRLKRETSRLEKKMKTESQFNRKVELRRELLARTTDLDTLSSPDPTS